MVFCPAIDPWFFENHWVVAKNHENHQPLSLTNVSRATCRKTLLMPTRNPGSTHQLRLVVEIPLFTRFSYIPGSVGFLPSTVSHLLRSKTRIIFLLVPMHFYPDKQNSAKQYSKFWTIYDITNKKVPMSFLA